MKRRMIYFAAVVMLLVTACSNDDNHLSVSTDSITFDQDVWERTVKVKTTGKWTASTNVDWCKPYQSSGDGDTDLLLWVSPNVLSEARDGKLTIRSGGDSKTVMLSQPAFSGSMDDFTYQLPVIFHILYKDKNDPRQYPEVGRMQEILQGVNKLYKDNNMNIQFVLPLYDQDGKSLKEEPGVIREEVTFDSISCMKFLDEKNTDYGYLNQDLQRYINVFVFAYSEEKLLGVSDLPVMPTEHTVDGLSNQAGKELQTFKTLKFPWGVTINNKYIDQKQDPGYINPLYVTLTLAHELGHYIGLLHTFSQNECYEDDYCDDTKNCDYNAYEEELTRYMNEIAATGNKIEAAKVLRRISCEDGTDYRADNILDYMYTLGNVFTDQQKKRVHSVLNYCPMTPGPKMETYSSAKTRSSEAFIKPRLSDCPPNGNAPINVTK
ncbi:MAG: zinc-dependent metalloproteinase lipoprotein [Prevotella sp.]|nr:zinc-dependent metalloproteinase lipoprotein [Prevotella sp.]